MDADGVAAPVKATDELKSYNSWYRDIIAYEREFKPWEERVKRILKEYRDDRGSSNAAHTHSRFNILWSNVQTLVPATFSRLPQPDVSRRFRDNDPVGRVSALLLERALDFEIQHYPDYRATLTESVQDRFLGGRGTCWARYEPHMRAAEQQLPEDGTEITDDADEPGEELDYECATIDYVHYKDFGHNVARTWEEVTRVWRKVYLDRAACIKRFGEDIGAKIPMDASPMKNERSKVVGGADLRALIYEGWDIGTKKATWFSVAMGKILDERDDPLGLEGFFPCPRPLYATITNDSLIPVPDYALYQDQARQLDLLSDKINGLIKALQVKGVYDAAVPELARLFTEAGNTGLIGVKNWSAFAEKNGLSGAIDLVDLIPIAQALRDAYEAFAQLKEQVYEITGISDIVRGASHASETATAQRLKGQYATLRLKAFQEQVALYATDCLRLKAQIICNKFEPETILKISAADQLSDADKQMVPQAMELLLGPRASNPELDSEHNANPLRSFRIDIAADTLVQIDEESEKASRIEFLTAVGGYMEKALPIVQSAPDAGSLVIDLLKFGVTGFKVGKQIEGSIDEALEKMRAAASQPKPQRADPEMAKVQAEQAKYQQEAALEQQRMQAEMAQSRYESNLESQRQMMQAQQDMAFERFKAMLEAKTRIEVAEISANTSLQQSQINAASQGIQ